MKIKLLRNTVLGTGLIGQKGKTYEVDDKDAKYLININKASAANGDQEAPSLDQVVIAIEQLDKDDDALWTNDDKPQVEALNQILGVNITAKLRNEAFEAYKASLTD